MSSRKRQAGIAQLVEQATENRRVPSSNLGPGISRKAKPKHFTVTGDQVSSTGRSVCRNGFNRPLSVSQGCSTPKGNHVVPTFPGIGIGLEQTQLSDRLDQQHRLSNLSEKTSANLVNQKKEAPSHRFLLKRL